jgi:hypothetical protein
MDTLHPTVVFEKVNDGLFNIEKHMEDWCEKYTSKNIRAPNTSMNLCCFNG